MIIETKIIEKPAFNVVGITETIHFDASLPPSENAIAKLWGRFGKRIPEISGQLGWRSFGLCCKTRTTRTVRHSNILPQYKSIRKVTSQRV